MTSQEGIKKWYLRVAKCYDLPQGWGNEELKTKHALHESLVQGAGHWFQFTKQPCPMREEGMHFIRSVCLGTVSVMKSQSCLNPHFLWSLLDGFPEKFFPSGRKLTMSTLVWPQARYISYLKIKDTPTSTTTSCPSHSFWLSFCCLILPLSRVFFFFFWQYIGCLLHYFSFLLLCLLLSYLRDLYKSCLYFLHSSFHLL